MFSTLHGASERHRRFLVGCVLFQASVAWAQVSTKTQSPAASPATESCRTIGEPVARLACYDRIFPPQAGEPLPVRSGVEPVPPAGSAAPADFGRPLPREPAANVQAVTSSIRGVFDGWMPTTRWTLNNGQVWAIADGSRTVYPRAVDARVRVIRGVFGGFYIEIDGVSQTPRVRRVDP